jgi:hypothetical protein
MKKTETVDENFRLPSALFGIEREIKLLEDEILTYFSLFAQIPNDLAKENINLRCVNCQP